MWVHELQTRLARVEQEQQAQSQAEKARLEELHWMHCPKCGQELMTERCDSVDRRLPKLQRGVVGCGRARDDRGEDGKFLPLLPACDSRRAAQIAAFGVETCSAAAGLTLSLGW